MVHEACMRAFLRYLMSIDHLKQLFEANECSGLVEAYVDSNWGSEQNNGRRSLSGCVIFVDRAPVKAFTRQQVSVALSSAEAELFAIVEGAKEAIGLAQLVRHVYGLNTGRELVPRVFSDSRAAINISSMQGLLRRVRHIDLRVCWIQAALQQGLITLNWVSGLQNPADLFTKALSKPQSHMSRIGIVEHCPRVQLETATLDVDVERLCSMMYRFVNVAALERLSCELDALNCQKIRWVVVEFCTSVNSGMRQASKEIEHVCVVCITEDENGLLDETIALVRSSIALWVERGIRVLVWSSTPCTGGCPYQYLNRQNPDYIPRLKRLWGVHRKLFKNLNVLVAPLPQLPAGCLHPHIAIDVQKFFSSWRRELRNVIVLGCSADVQLIGRDGYLIKKQWRVTTDLPSLADRLSRVTCDGSHSHSSTLT